MCGSTILHWCGSYASMVCTESPGGGPLAETGVLFPADESGARKSLGTNRDIWAASVADQAPQIETAISVSKKWRADYVGLCRDVTVAAAPSHEAARNIAAAGLAAARSTLVFERGGDALPLSEATEVPATFGFETETLVGESEPATELAVPYRGEMLSGDALRRRLADWVYRGIIEPSASSAISTVIDNPDWLRLEGHRVVVVGAGAQTSPLPVLTSWGVEVVATDLPSQRVWNRIAKWARRGASKVHVPVRPGTSGELADRAGSNISEEAPEFADWLAQFADKELAVGFYVYADGALHVQATMATDLVMQRLRAAGIEPIPAFAGTPTECFLVSEDVVRDSDERRRSRFARTVEVPIRRLSMQKLYAPAYTETLLSEEGDVMAVADAIVDKQGPNYLLAKRLQRWSAIDAWHQGKSASFNVAPPTWTVSVTKNKLLAAGYYGARRAGLEVFEPNTMSAIMTALLVYDLNVERPVGMHPELEITRNGVHGGYWRVPHDIRTTLLFSGVVGLPEAFLPSRQR